MDTEKNKRRTLDILHESAAILQDMGCECPDSIKAWAALDITSPLEVGDTVRVLSVATRGKNGHPVDDPHPVGTVATVDEVGAPGRPYRLTAKTAQGCLDYWWYFRDQLALVSKAAPKPKSPPEEPKLPEWVKVGAWARDTQSASIWQITSVTPGWIGARLIGCLIDSDITPYNYIHGRYQPWTPQPDEQVSLVEGAKGAGGLLPPCDYARVSCGPDGHGDYNINLYKDGKRVTGALVKLDQLLPYTK